MQISCTDFSHKALVEALAMWVTLMEFYKPLSSYTVGGTTKRRNYQRWDGRIEYHRQRAYEYARKGSKKVTPEQELMGKFWDRAPLIAASNIEQALKDAFEKEVWTRSPKQLMSTLLDHVNEEAISGTSESEDSKKTCRGSTSRSASKSTDKQPVSDDESDNGED